MDQDNASKSVELPEPMPDSNGKNTPVNKPNQYYPASSSTPQPLPGNVQPVTNDNNLMADDVDLIEKEWVTKAKAIVAQTIHDPSAQAEELQKMKAEYLKKRYNKDLKADKG